MNKDIVAYNLLQPTEEFQDACQTLMNKFDSSLDGAESKIFHRNPAWFLDGNPIVGYYVPAKKDRVRVMFWSGQSFDEPGLEAEGSFKAATKDYLVGEAIDTAELKRWLEKAKRIQWDYKNIVKKKGQLDRLI